MSALGGIGSGFGEGVKSDGTGMVVGGTSPVVGLRCLNALIACWTVVSRRIVD